MYVCGKPAGSGVTPGAPDPQNDQQPPTVYITSPSIGSTVPAQTTVRANVSDNIGLSKVELYVDGKLSASTSAGPFDFPVALQPGKHLLTLRAFDAAGNNAEAQTTVTVAGVGPDQSTPGQPGGQLSPGSLSYGQACQRPGDCGSAMCANDVSLGLQYCSQTCTPGVNACPAGSSCYPANAGVYVCAVDQSPPSQQQQPGGQGLQTQGAAVGCSVTRAPDVAPWMLILLGLLLVSRRRRR